VRKALSEQSPETLFALRLATAITGSAVLALALWRRAFPPGEIFEASRIDERFQEERWGVDDEAKAREDRMRAEFMSVSRFLRMLK
jgi:chaperone required for assembly of F1-ATPase